MTATLPAIAETGDAYIRADQTILRTGQWVETKTGIGKLSMFWRNPDFGLMTSLTHFRSFAAPETVDRIWVIMTDKKATKFKPHCLDTAHPVTGPMKADGTRPARDKVEKVVMA